MCDILIALRKLSLPFIHSYAAHNSSNMSRNCFTIELLQFFVQKQLKPVRNPLHKSMRLDYCKILHENQTCVQTPTYLNSDVTQSMIALFALNIYSCVHRIKSNRLISEKRSNSCSVRIHVSKNIYLH